MQKFVWMGNVSKIAREWFLMGETYQNLMKTS